MIPVSRGLLMVVILACAPDGGAAQAAPPSVPAAPRVVGGQDGFGIESGNGDFRLQIGLLVHADGRFALDDDNELYVDNFSLRRVRPFLRGRIARRFEFYLNPDFINGTLVVQDAYVDTVFAPGFRVRAGKGKTPFGFERLHSASNILFMERAFPTALVPNRDIGVQALGDISGGVVSYLAGVMNGVADGGSADVDYQRRQRCIRACGRPAVHQARRERAARAGFWPVRFAGGCGRRPCASSLPDADAAAALFLVRDMGSNPVTADGTRSRYSPQAW